MSVAAVECPMCGTRFDATSICDACPLNGSCQTACCPSCGYAVVEIGRSAVIRALRRLRRPAADGSLADVRRGAVVQVAQLPAEVARRVGSYGIEPGRRIEVLQRTPVTVVRVDEIEVAIERSVATAIRVEATA